MTLSKNTFRNYFHFTYFIYKNGLSLDEQSLHEEYEFWNFFRSAEGEALSSASFLTVVKIHVN